MQALHCRCEDGLGFEHIHISPVHNEQYAVQHYETRGDVITIPRYRVVVEHPEWVKMAVDWRGYAEALATTIAATTPHEGAIKWNLAHGASRAR